MKKLISMFLLVTALVLLLIIVPSNQVQAKKIEEFDVEQENGKLAIEGTAENGTLAVAVMVYDEEDELVKMETTSVNSDNTFATEVEVEEGNYVVKVADYDGGEYLTKEVGVAGKEQYTVTGEGIFLTFTDDEGHEFEAVIVDILKLTPAEREVLGIEDEEYEEAKKILEESIKEYGEMLAVYVIEISDENYDYTDGATIKIKITDEMKNFNTFKLINMDENTYKAKDVVELKVDGEYLVGKLPHLSVYALAATNVEEETTTEEAKTEEKTAGNPTTGDNIVLFVGIFVAAAVGVVTIAIVNKKKTTKK